MLLSKKLLNSINDKFKSFNNQDYINAFNKIGCEVETIKPINVVKGLVAGKIIDIQKVPESDHLNVCKVQTQTETLQIVCDAKNACLNANVIVAKIGTKFSDNFVISERKLKGVVSQGMLCAYSEIVSDSINCLNEIEKQSIITINDNNFKLDTDIYDYLNLDDEIIELSLPSNRNDLNGVLSIVNELNYAFNLNFSFITKEIKNTPNTADIKINFSNEAKQLINSYAFGLIELKEQYIKTDWQIKSILINSNIFVTDTVADIANYITLLTAQPIHFYDYDKLGNDLNFEVISSDKTINSINDVETTLKKGTLVSISNNQVCAAIGLIGSNHCKVTNETKKVLFETINIDSSYISKISKENNISNNSSALFSKPLSSFFISKVYYYLTNFYDKSVKLVLSEVETNKKTFKYDANMINQILGLNLNSGEILSILNKVGFEVKIGTVHVPKNRLDIESNQDLAEEVLKSLDINSFISKPIVSSYTIQEKNHELELIDNLSNQLISKGFYEVKTQNLVSKELINNFNDFELDAYELFNPMNSNRAFFRTSLKPQLLDVLSNNVKKKNNLFNLFEIQKVYGKNKNINLLTIFISKPLINDVYDKYELSYKDITYLLNDLFNKLKIEYKLVNLKDYEKSVMVGDKVVGLVSKIKPSVLKQHQLKDVYCLELFLDELTDNSKQISFIKPTSLNPIFRELTFFNKNDNNINEYFDSLKNIDLIEEVSLINVFNSETKKTYTIQLKINNKDNLTSDQITEIFNKAIKLLNDYGLELDN